MLHNLYSSASGGKLVDSNAAVEGQLQKELDKVARQYGGGPGVDMTKFPSLTFKGMFLLF